MNSGNGGHGSGYFCNKNCDFCIIEYDKDVVNDVDDNDGDDGFEKCVPFDTHQARNICTNCI